MTSNPYSPDEQQTCGDGHSFGPKFDQQLRTMQIIAVALVMGVLTFLCVVLVSTQGDVLTLQEPDVISLIGIGFGAVMIVGHFVVPGVVSAAQLRQVAAEGISEESEGSKVEKYCGIFQTRLIVGLALLEGAAFFNLIALMTETNGINFGAVMVLLVVMLTKFPTKTKVSWWIQDRLREH